jgi:nuclear pore complex protein Nup98-Nup96
VKKLVLDRKVDSSDIFAKTVGRAAPGSLKAGASGSSSKITFNPALSIAAREAAGQDRGESPAPVPKKTGAARFNSAREPSVAPEAPSAEGSLAKVGGNQLQDGDYYIKPSIDKLKSLGYEQLTAFEGLVVGRVGRGEVQFLEPVNLTEVPRLQELMGGLIQFGDQDCVIYPDYDEADKPPPGQGINVPARIEILGAWPLDRATKEPIKDETHPSAAKHLKRLQKMKETRFESFDFKTGKWTFTVDHF